MRVEIRSNGSLNFSDSTVSDAILNQVSSHLLGVSDRIVVVCKYNVLSSVDPHKPQGGQVSLESPARREDFSFNETDQ